MSDVEAIAEYADPWEAELAKHYLEDAGIDAWLEGAGPERRLLGEGTARVRLVVPWEAAPEARALLEEMGAEEAPRARGRPMWIAAVAALVAAALVATAVPRVLWVPLLLIGFVGYLVWASLRPGPGRDGERD